MSPFIMLLSVFLASTIFLKKEIIEAQWRTEGTHKNVHLFKGGRERKAK
jgi:hypothetical protein